ncbi:hypothetical protein C8F01DRAFT_1339661 [Mycena amicta]|nr:hypothetical protein C8F01DRAFT_1379927 [Mycena amicta]KAJ7051282.1 hypothetical protein C8F01DRAFT_1339661 [Mycena amicta]
MDDVTAQLTQEIRMHDCLHLIGITLLFYDHLITFGDEVRLLWRRARTTSAHWFFAVRYAGLVGNIPVTVFSFYSLSGNWCHVYHTGHQIVIVGTQLLACVVMLLRTHALYGRSRRFLAILLSISLCLIAVVVWSTLGQHSYSIDAFPGCHVVVVDEATQYHLAAAWESLFAFDAMIFILTLYKTYSTWRHVGSYTHIPVHTLILRDGALYFGAMALANLGNILTFYLAGPVLAGALSTIASCVSVTMVSRLMLNLHHKTDVGIFSEAAMGLGLGLHTIEDEDEFEDGGGETREGVVEPEPRDVEEVEHNIGMQASEYKS